MLINNLKDNNLGILAISLAVADPAEYAVIKDMLKAITNIDITTLREISEDDLRKLREFETKYRDMLIYISVTKHRHSFFYVFAYLYERISFNRILGLLIISFGCGYIWYVTTNAVPVDNLRFVDTVLGFVLGTMLSTVINFYFGSSTAPPKIKTPLK